MYTHAQIRRAMLAAALHIEINPNDYSFIPCQKPVPGVKPGCLFGWTGYFLGFEPLKSSPATYTDQLAQQSGLDWRALCYGHKDEDLTDPHKAAQLLREFAQKNYSLNESPA